MTLSVRGIETGDFERLRAGGPDANGRPPERRPAEPANPCRHCLELIEPGDDELVLAYRPFLAPQPYAEIGPIFLHAAACARYESGALPWWFEHLDPALVRGYDERDWIRYDTGDAVPGPALRESCELILEDPRIRYVHVRSKFGCFQCRVDRG